MLSDMSLETGQIQDQGVDMQVSSSEARKVLEESSAIASQQMKERFPELPLPEARASATEVRVPVAVTAGGEEEIPGLPSVPLEQRLFDYIRSHNGELTINSCASDLTVSPDDVRRSLQKLKDDGKVVTD